MSKMIKNAAKTENAPSFFTPRQNAAV